MSSDIESEPNRENLKELHKTIQTRIRRIILKDAINWINSSWNGVTQQTIENCFRKSGFDSTPDVIEIDSNSENEELVQSLELMQTVLKEPLISENEFIEIDDSIVCVSTDWKNDPLDDAEEFGTTEEILINESESKEHIESRPPLNATQVLEKLEEIEDFVLSQTPEMFDHFNQLKNSVIYLKSRLKKLTQKSITDYFHNI